MRELVKNSDFIEDVEVIVAKRNGAIIRQLTLHTRAGMMQFMQDNENFSNLLNALDESKCFDGNKAKIVLSTEEEGSFSLWNK